MIDRKKVKTGIFEMLQRDTWKDIDKERHRFQPVLNDALNLLKEQEPVPPDVDSEGSCSCGNCGATVGYYPAGCKTPEKLCTYCPECGKMVKWE